MNELEWQKCHNSNNKYNNKICNSNIINKWRIFFNKVVKKLLIDRDLSQILKNQKKGLLLQSWNWNNKRRLKSICLMIVIVKVMIVKNFLMILLSKIYMSIKIMGKKMIKLIKWILLLRLFNLKILKIMVFDNIINIKINKN